MNIIGWQNITPALAAFIAVESRRPEFLRSTLLNLFLVGNQGTNKTGAARRLATLFEKSFGELDASTIDEITEVAGMIDLHANRARGEFAMLSGDKVHKDWLLFDELLNVKAHLLSQTRHFLQGKMSVNGHDINLGIEAIFAAGNLSSNMKVGTSNSLDSPTADRFAMVIEVPRLCEMDKDSRTAIIEGRSNDAFERQLIQAVQDIQSGMEEVLERFGTQVTEYVDALVMDPELADTYFSFEGRRSQLLRLFVLAALALCEKQPDLDRDTTIYKIVEACLAYHRLCGVELDMSKLQIAHQTALAAFNDNRLEAAIAVEPSIARKIGLIIDDLRDCRERGVASTLNDLVRLSVFASALERGDLILKLACRKLLTAPLFAHESPELLRMFKIFPCQPRNHVPEVKMDDAEMLELSNMDPRDIYVFQLAEGKLAVFHEMLSDMDKQLREWRFTEV